MKSLTTLFLCLYTCLGFSQEPPLEKILQITKEITGGHEGKIEVKKISGGLTNDNYKVTAGLVSFFFRINSGKNAILGSSIEREWKITSLVSQFSIAPKVFYYDPVDGILVTDFIPAKSSTTDLRDKMLLRQFCRLVSSLHQLKMEFPTQYDPYANIEAYMSSALEVGISLPEALENSVLPAINSFQKAADSSLIITKTPAHLDLHGGNVLDDGNQLWLIDWEYAAMADPYFDLASLASIEYFSDHEMEELLEYYLERTPTDQEIDYFWKMRILADTRWALWCYLQAKISPLDEPFEKVGHEFLEHCLERIIKLQRIEEDTAAVNCF